MIVSLTKQQIHSMAAMLMANKDVDVIRIELHQKLSIVSLLSNDSIVAMGKIEPNGTNIIERIL